MGATLFAADEFYNAPATNPAGYEYCIGVVGNPSMPDIRWSDEELAQIKALGGNIA